MSMILLDGMGRSGTSLLARLMASMLEPKGYAYYYEPFHHPTPVGLLEDWQAMIGRVLLPNDSDPQLQAYLKRMEEVGGGQVFWKEIRLALKQDWLLHQFPDLKIVHITRDIMGVLSSHRKSEAPAWMTEHRKIWRGALLSWLSQPDRLLGKGLNISFEPALVQTMSDLEQYALVWALNEAFIRRITSSRLLLVSYEDLCVEPMRVLPDIGQFLGMEVSPEQLNLLRKMMESENTGLDPSGPWQESASRNMPEIWRQRLALKDQKAIESVSGSVRRMAGYSPPKSFNSV